MRLHLLIDRPIESYVYLERYVNDGSPSGYSFAHSVSRPYHPLYGHPTFDLPIFLIPRNRVIKEGRYEDLPCWGGTTDGSRLPIPVHPDLLGDVSLPVEFSGAPDLMIPVTPTASARTVLTNWRTATQPLFIKLHYPRKIGRFNRGIPLFKWLASIESARLTREYLHRFGSGFGVFDEFAGAYIESDRVDNGVGTIFRSLPNVLPDSTLIPAFALFSYDRQRPRDPTLLAQIISEFNYGIEDVIEQFVSPLVYSYVHLCTSGGLIPECNAQNLVFQVTTRGNVKRIFLRDMEDMWKDLTVMAALGLGSQYVEYHTIQEGVDRDYYRRRSFMFDFKLSEYVLLPMAISAASALNLSEKRMSDRIKEIVQHAWEPHPDYFQPRDRWFCYPKELHVSRDHYEERLGPLFRT
jgi:hypothetical protein